VPVGNAPLEISHKTARSVSKIANAEENPVTSADPALAFLVRATPPATIPTRAPANCRRAPRMLSYRLVGRPQSNCHPTGDSLRKTDHDLILAHRDGVQPSESRFLATVCASPDGFADRRSRLIGVPACRQGDNLPVGGMPRGSNSPRFARTAA
jgi:hypothetical protein